MHGYDRETNAQGCPAGAIVVADGVEEWALIRDRAHAPIARQIGLRHALHLLPQLLDAGHAVLLDHLGLEPVFDLDMRLGEGTGAALAMGLVDAGLKVLREMATFGEAGVDSEKIN